MTWRMLAGGPLAPIDALSTWLVQSGVLLAVGLLAGRLLRGRGPAVQSALYRTTLVAVVLCPAASMMMATAGFKGVLIRLPAPEVTDASVKMSPPSDPALRPERIGVEPIADRAAWRRAGSPRTWRVNQEFGLATPYGPSASESFSITAGRGPLFDLDASSSAKPFVVGNTFLSYRQLLALPASPRLLKKLLLRGDPPWYLGSTTSYLFQTTPTVLDLPVTPAVRAALYRMLAALPGVKSVGRVQDITGQQRHHVADVRNQAGHVPRQIGRAGQRPYGAVHRGGDREIAGGGRGLHPRPQRTEGVEPLGPDPLPVAGLQVARGDVGRAGKAEDHLVGPLPRHLTA